MKDKYNPTEASTYLQYLDDKKLYGQGFKNCQYLGLRGKKSMVLLLKK